MISRASWSAGSSIKFMGNATAGQRYLSQSFEGHLNPGRQETGWGCRGSKQVEAEEERNVSEPGVRIGNYS